MAADQYDEFGGNGGYGQQEQTPDWWTQNAPAPTTGSPRISVPRVGIPKILGAGDDGQTVYYGGPPDAQPDNSGVTFGGPVAPFTGGTGPTFTRPPLPANLQRGFELPTADDLLNSPGYLARYNLGKLGRERGYAARGTILNGGSRQALDRYSQDYAQTGYNDLVNNKLNERQQQSSDYLNLAFGPAWQENQAAQNQFGQLYRQYADSVSNNRNSQNDYYDQQLGLLKLGLSAAQSGNPGMGQQG